MHSHAERGNEKILLLGENVSSSGEMHADAISGNGGIIKILGDTYILGSQFAGLIDGGLEMDSV